MYDLILHIGASKAGSSAIQDFLRRNKNIFRELGYIIPDKNLGLSEKVTGEHVFALQNFFDDSDSAGLTSAISALIGEENNHTVILSAENISNLDNYKYFRKTCKRFRVKIIFYIRRQDEFFSSAWQQWYSKIYSDMYAWLISSMNKIGNWKSTIEDWESLVGKQNIKVRIFDQSEFSKGNICFDFIECLGRKKDLDLFDYAAKPVNPSYNEMITDLVSGNKAIFKNINDHDFYEMIKDLSGEEYIADTKVSLMSRGVRDSIMSYFSDQNNIVCKRYFPNRDALFKPIDHSKYIYLSDSQKLDKKLDFLTTMIYGLYRSMKANEKHDGVAIPQAQNKETE